MGMSGRTRKGGRGEGGEGSGCVEDAKARSHTRLAKQNAPWENKWGR